MHHISIDNLTPDDLRTLIRECVRTELKDLFKTGQEKSPEDLISILEVCEIFKVSKVTIHKWKRIGLIPFHKVNRKLYFKRSELLRCIEQDTKNRYRL